MNYYNEWDSFAADWLRELIKDGLIPDGEVDNRSIADVRPEDLKGFTQCHFFAGIGGWSRALQLAGWSSDRPVWTGSPPCQSFSTAGKGKGKDDERHLWPVFFNLIRECQPPTVFGEQVAAAIRYGWLDDLQIDFEKEGYAAGAFVLPAGGIGAPHKRERLFFVADSNFSNRRSKQEPEQQARNQWRKSDGDSGVSSSVADSNDKRHEWSQEAGREARSGTEYASSVSMADSSSQRQWRERDVRQRLSSETHGEGKDDRSINDGSLGMADSGSAGREGSIRFGATGEERQSERYSSECSGAGSVADSSGSGREGRRSSERSEQRQIGQDGALCASAPVGDSDSDRSEQRDKTAETAGHGNSINSASFWADSREIYCRDGKYRPVPTEPALFPLANGISNRVGILRGAGNAIVPQAAAEIIKAYLS